MNNNEMIKYKESFITKIKKIFEKLFKRKEEQYNYVQQKSMNELVEAKKEVSSNFFDNIKAYTKANTNAVKHAIDRQKFLEEIKGNEELLNMLSIDRLKKLEKYYDSVIAENEKKIRKLRATK